MTRIASLAAVIAASMGCIIVDAGPPPPRNPVVVVPVNSVPYVYDAFAGCSYDPYNRDDIWTFDAFVDDPDGIYDVVAVYADVYDDRSGYLIQSFELYPTQDPYRWFSDWLASTTYLDCSYPWYSVDVTVYDLSDAASVLTILPATY